MQNSKPLYHVVGPERGRWLRLDSDGRLSARIDTRPARPERPCAIPRPDDSKTRPELDEEKL
jgi:hypothetical protein